ncbi:MAG: hypothetical protein LBR47_02880 [Spirochaetaceae bacterium]|nr:hypothetical protein [Spirochaetaceae bacterium]
MKKTVYGIMAAALFCVTLTGLYGAERNGADYAAPYVASFLEALSLPAGESYAFTYQDTEQMLGLSADTGINIFELIDCMYRYLAPRRMRISISGEALRSLQSEFDLGGERVLAILSVEKLRYLELGAVLSSSQSDLRGQNALDVYLDSPCSKYIEIGTASYEARFGFKTITPLLLADAYGVTVKRLFVTTPLTKLELYAPGKGAIYVKALSRPKKWNLDIISRI